MASGHVCLNLAATLTWEAFPSFADRLLTWLGGSRLRIANGVDFHLWDVGVDGASLQLVFDDFPAMVSLEANDKLGDEVLRRIHAQMIGTPDC